MNGIISKIGRMAASKAAAFGYAVAVGVAGNLAFNFVQEHHAATAVTAPRDSGPAAAVLAPDPMPALAMRESPPAAPARAVAPAPLLPEPPVAPVLPNPAALPPPTMRPTVLPGAAAAAPAPSASRPLPPAVSALLDPRRPAAPPHQPAAVASEPAVPPPAAPSGAATAPAPPQVAALPPLGPAIEVAPLPTPPDRAPPPAVMAALPPPAKPAPRSAEPPHGFAFGDVWHPYYQALTQGVHWAGRHVPLIGDSDAAPQPSAIASGAPISLLPPAALERTDAAPPRKPTAPGPGSGGLY